MFRIDERNTTVSNLERTLSDVAEEDPSNVKNHLKKAWTEHCLPAVTAAVQGGSTYTFDFLLWSSRFVRKMV